MLIIDGYNLLRAIQAGCDEYPSITDSQMCALLSSFARLKKDKAKIVFDGIGPPDKTPLKNIARVEVMFSGQYKEADDIIEQLIIANTAPKLLTVVSSDRRIRAAAKKRKAASPGSLEFWQTLVKELSKPGKIREPREKLTGISDGETDHWLKEFGLNDSTER